MNKLINSHRSIRKYKADPIGDDLLSKILEAGTHASTTGNMQVYSMIVSRDQEIKKKLWEAHFKQNMVLQAPVHITFCADFNRFNTWCKIRNATPGYNNFLSFFTASIDALLVSQNVCLAAEEKGLGICYLGTATYNADKIIEILDLPKNVVPVAALVMGYPEEIPEINDRLPVEAVIHYEKYKNFTPELIENIYYERENTKESIEFVKLNNKQSLAQIFTDIRYTKKDNEFFSEKYLATIKKQGFNY